MNNKQLIITSLALAMISFFLLMVAPELASSQSGTPVGSGFATIQKNWKGTQTATFAIDSVARSYAQSDFWKKYFLEPYPGNNRVKLATLTGHLTSQNLTTNDNIVAKNATIDSSYLISSAFTASGGDSALWKTLTFSYNAKNGEIRAYYRVSDTSGTTDPADETWIAVNIPPTGKGIAKFTINKTAKYLQYKINLGGKSATVDAAAFTAVPVTIVIPTPTPTPSSTTGTGTPSPQSSVSPTPETGTGTMTIVTKKLLSSVDDDTGEVIPSSPNPGASNPFVTPSPGVNKLCFSDQETEPAAGVGLNIKLRTGPTRVDNERTDDDGVWHGLEGAVDDFPVGIYDVSLSDFERTDFKLLALCVSPDDGLHHLRTQINPATKKAALIVRPGQETRLIALYGPRNKPFISMNKFAVEGTLADNLKSRKVLKRIYPGQTFLYLIRYENTGADAKEVVIRDVLTPELLVPEEVEDNFEKYGFTIETDTRQRRVVTKRIDTLTAGEKGSFYIPVALDPDGFGKDSIFTP